MNESENRLYRVDTPAGAFYAVAGDADEAKNLVAASRGYEGREASVTGDYGAELVPLDKAHVLPSIRTREEV